MELTVSTLRNILEDALDQLKDYKGSDVVSTKNNTQWVNEPYLGTMYGFVDLRNIFDEDDDDWYDDDEFDESRKYKPLRDRKLESRIHRLEKLLRK